MALIPPANSAGIALPAAPANPPTVEDVRAAQQYTVQVRNSCESGASSCCTAADVVAAAEYEQAILSQRAGDAVAPLWFAPVQAQLNRMEDRLNRIENRMRALADNLGRVSNATKSNGHTYSFNIINFNHDAPVNPGVDPTIIGLPALFNSEAINGLNNDDVDRYCQGYGIPAAGPYIQRKRAIARRIGCHDLGVLLA